ncbi:hypothetical protein [Enterovirga aerilata]|uniref:Uncharacterized protein n=1 Tax=Enterovirga aerilata TaxID=2730920 RepID=A0A849IAP5_9HYPH|nr:hypothetical protein [Enterovirga sp. DB1703]NNM73067.1 hypothetical protein [Enterovirga sp. DB1703]
MTKRIVGWKLDRAERAALLARFPPAYPDPVADHVTLARSAEAALPARPRGAELIGRADDGAGVECLVVRLDGTTDRPGGGTYHVTWSLDRAKGRTAKESNDVLRERGWTDLPEPVPIRLEPAAWDS